MLPFSNPLFGRGEVGLSPPPPIGEASIDFDFVGSQYRLGNQLYPSLDAIADVTFQRAGEQGAVGPNGSVSWFATDVPAINERGFHCYSSVTNFAPNSQALNQWATYSGPVVSGIDVTAAPDGSTSADEVTFGGAPAGQVYQGISGPSGVATISVFAQSPGAKKFRLKGFVAGADNYSGDFSTNATWQRFVHIVTAPSGIHGQVSIGEEDNGGAGSVRFWQGQLLGGNFVDGGPLVRTAQAAVTVGPSLLSVAFANGDYVATYTFDDGSEQVVPVTIGDGRFRHATHGTLSRGIVRRVRVVAA